MRNTGLDRVLDKTISVDSKKDVQANLEAYTLIKAELGANPVEVLFVFFKFMGCDWRRDGRVEGGVDRGDHTRGERASLFRR